MKQDPVADQGLLRVDHYVQHASLHSMMFGRHQKPKIAGTFPSESAQIATNRTSRVGGHQHQSGTDMYEVRKILKRSGKS